MRPEQVQPFALDANELEDIETFARRNNLHNIARLCAELRALRAEYVSLSKRVGRQSAMIEQLQPDPHVRYVSTAVGSTNAPSES